MTTASYSRSSRASSGRERLGQQLAGVGRAAAAEAARRASRAAGGSRPSASTSPSRTSISPGVRVELEQLGDAAAAQVARRRGASWRRRARASPRAPKATVVLPWLPSGLVTTIERMLVVGEEQVRAQVAQRFGDDAQARVGRQVLGRVHLQDRRLGGDLREDRAPLVTRPGPPPSRPSWSGSHAAGPRRARGRGRAARRRTASASCAGRPVWSAEPAGRARAASATGSRPAFAADAVEQRPRRRGGAQLRQPRLRAAGLDLHDPRALERLDRDRAERRPRRCSRARCSVARELAASA